MAEIASLQQFVASTLRVRFLPLLAGVAICIAAITWLYNELAPIDRRLSLTARKKWKLPPGPRGVPFLGNLIDLGRAAKSNPEKLLTRLAGYGEMTTLRLGSRTWVLLNSHRVTHEIIAKRGNITSERNHMPVASGIVSRGMRSLLQPTAKWTENRRVMHHLLSGSALQQYGEWQELESTQMMAEYLFHPDLWYAHHYRYANSVVHRIALGTRIEASGEDLSNLQRLVSEFVGSIGSSMADWFPILDKLPRWLQLWRPFWEKIGQFHNDVYHKWWDPVRDAIKQGTAPPSWGRDVLLEPGSAYTGNAEEAMYTAMQLIEAGSDTTREALNIFIMAMIHHPRIFQRIRAEVDNVCDIDGSIRSPTMGDISTLPWVAATVKEVLRWRPIFPFTPEHTLSKDLDFEGYKFPAGVSFVINGVAVGNDCEDPHSFDPSRWLDGNEMNVAHGLWQFGGGRRICVGYRLAQRGLVLNIARLAQCFDFAANGLLDSTRLNHETNQEPFPIKVSVRGERYRKLIKENAMDSGVLDIARTRREAPKAYTFQRASVLA
ncbi:hypothetical protein CKM354_001204500 [Cercospora kikuchii]|uniref:Cytochrome P450 n=1 Tax=Cercospora kikuchii TaxID=84275 RepID=A0A9P3FL96_9PEZI|nr:uncharacterized protein CKM354_001204500 [Cercospora kikuchii]GIZ49004.1 hypothetical protein CKM354_001204500 [Cercospora kikuchii]